MIDEVIKPGYAALGAPRTTHCRRPVVRSRSGVRRAHGRARHRGLAQHRCQRAPSGSCPTAASTSSSTASGCWSPGRTRRRACTPATDRCPMRGVRLHAGRGPGLLGVPADELHDRTLPLDAVWGDRRARELTERVAASPRRALAAWARSGVPDRFGASVRTLLDRGLSVADVAEATGYSARQLHRRTLPVFGYGPQHLARVLRLGRALRRGRRRSPVVGGRAAGGLCRPGPPRPRRARAGRRHPHRPPARTRPIRPRRRLSATPSVEA